MRHFQAILVAASILVLLFSCPRSSPAQDGSAHEVPAGKLTVKGKVTNAEGSPVRNAKVTISSGQTVKAAISNKDGEFRITGLSPQPANVAYDAPGYNRLEEQGVPLTDGMDLSKTLEEKGLDSRWAFLLLIPAVLGLSYCALTDCFDEKKRREQFARVSGSTPTASSPRDLHFGKAAFGAWAWLITLFAWVLIGGHGTRGVDTIYLFNWSLPMEVYVPAFGLVGSLLFVLDIRRRFGREAPTNNPGGKEPTYNPEEEIPKGKEFGMRIFMGPYVAIVVVLLFNRDLTSPEAKVAVSFFSGLLVVMALQGLVEKGQKVLGEWRKEANIKIFQKREEELEKVMGNVVWARLRDIGVNTVPEFAHLDDPALDTLAIKDPKLFKEDLKTLRDRARKLAMAS